MPFLAYFGWVSYVCFIRVDSNLNYTNERKYLERMRGTAYILSLLITLIFNFVAFTYRPDIIVTIFVIVIVGIGLIATLFLVEWFFFRFDKNIMTKENRDATYKILMEMGIASIYYSLIINIILFTKFIFDQVIVQIAIALVVQGIFLFRFFIADRRSIALCDQLSTELSGRNWYARYQNLLRTRG
jgi:small-conductance mechanosensitive channel